MLSACKNEKIKTKKTAEHSMLAVEILQDDKREKFDFKMMRFSFFLSFEF